MIRELLKLGTWSGGKVTRKIIKQVLRNFSETDRAPVVRGHTIGELSAVHTTEANLGWVEKLWTSGDLTNTVGKVELNEAGKKAYFEDGFENCSSGLRKNPRGEWYLHHLGLLSAVPPSIKNLQVYDHADGGNTLLVYKDKNRIEFIYPAEKRNFAQEGNPMAEAEKTQSTPVSVPATTSQEASRIKLIEVIRKQREMLRDMKKSIKAMQKKNSRQESKLANHADAVLKQKKDVLQKAASGKIPKQQLDSLLQFADHFPGDTMEFGDNKKEDLFTLLTAIFTALPKPVPEGEMNMGDLPENDQPGEFIPVSEYIGNV